MNLYERWKEDGMRVLCDKDSLKAFEDIGYKLSKCPCEYIAPEVQEAEVADLPTEDKAPEEVVPEMTPEVIIPEVVDAEKQSKRGRKSKSQEEIEDKVTGPDIVL